jgi:glucokinase
MFRHATAIGADIGHNTLRIAVVKMEGEIIASRTYPLNGPPSKEDIIKSLLLAVRDIRKTVASKGVNPICIGISVKGFIDHGKGVVLGPDQGIDGWINVPLAKTVHQETGLPVYIGNDANMMTIAEHRFGAGKGFNDLVFVALRTGIGGGIIINGKLYRGVNNAGGEVGQMIINQGGDVSDKGIAGSWEHYASASAVIRRYRELSGEQVKQNKYSCREIFELSYNKSSTAVQVIEENATLVGVGIANLIAIFAPEIIIIGGGMSEAKESYFNMIVNSAVKNSLENCRTGVRIVKAHLGASASLLGVSFYALTRLAGKNV